MSMSQNIIHRRQKSFTHFEHMKRDILVAQDIIKESFRVNGSCKLDGFKEVLACQNNSFHSNESTCLKECLSFPEGSAPISFDCPCLFFEKSLKKINFDSSLKKIQEINVSSLNYVDFSKELSWCHHDNLSFLLGKYYSTLVSLFSSLSFDMNYPIYYELTTRQRGAFSSFKSLYNALSIFSNNYYNAIFFDDIFNVYFPYMKSGKQRKSYVSRELFYQSLKAKKLIILFLGDAKLKIQSGFNPNFFVFENFIEDLGRTNCGLIVFSTQNLLHESKRLKSYVSNYKFDYNKYIKEQPFFYCKTDKKMKFKSFKKKHSAINKNDSEDCSYDDTDELNYQFFLKEHCFDRLIESLKKGQDCLQFSH